MPKNSNDEERGVKKDELIERAYENAHAWVAKGFLVHPLHTTLEIAPGIHGIRSCSCGGFCSSEKLKRPILSKWNREASSDRGVIDEWLHPGKGMYRGSHVGLVTGRSADFIVLDLDGETGLADFEYLQEQHGSLPKTLTVSTPGGGEHHYFQYPKISLDEYVPTIAKIKLEDRRLHIDVRGDNNGYVVAPGCVALERGEYIMTQDLPLASLPVEYLPLLVRPKPAPATSGNGSNVAPLKTSTRQVPPEVSVLLQNCAFLAHCRNDQATLGRDEWLAMLTLISRCENGHAWGQEFSQKHPTYSAEDCDKHIAEARDKMGPRTCATISSHFTDCAQCKWRNAATTPLQVETAAAISRMMGSYADSLSVHAATANTLQAVDLPVPSAVTVGTPIEKANALLPVASSTEIANPLIAPPGYRFNCGNVERGFLDKDGNEEWEIIVEGCLSIRNISANIHSGDTYLTLIYKRDNIAPVEVQLPRSFLADPRSLGPLLAGRNIPVLTKNVDAVAAYIQAYQLYAEAQIPQSQLSSHCGWLDERVLLYGGDCIGGNFILDPKYDDGLAVAGLIPKGCLEAWAALYKITVKSFPVMHFCLLASLASPLLKILNVDTFWIEFACKTSTGKTVALQLAASVWGAPKALVGTWATTANAAERRASLLNAFPLILNETKAWPGRPEALVKFYYAMSEGRSKQRAKPDGMQAALVWSLVCFSSSEYPISDYTQGSGGVHARTISILQPPSGGIHSPQVGQLIRKLLQAAENNHGTLGRAFIQWLVQQDYDNIRAEFNTVMGEFEQTLSAQSVNSTVAVRMLPYFAAIEMAGRLAHRAAPALGDYGSPVMPMMETTISHSTQDADQPTAALRLVVDWLYENQHRFTSGTTSAQGPLNQSCVVWDNMKECLGIWNNACECWDSVYVLQNPLDKILKENRYSTKAILAEWRDRDWIKTEGKKRTRYRLTFTDGTKKSFIRITRAAIQAVQESTV